MESTALAADHTGQLGGFRTPSRAELEAAVAPFVVKRMPLSTAEWKELYERAAKKERKLFRRHQWKQWFPWRKHARPKELVSTHYETHWSKLDWPKVRNPPVEKPVLCTWGDEGLLVRRYGRKRAHHLFFSRLMQSLAPENALEIGSGNGINLLIMSTLFPRVRWSGVELTEAGVAVGRSIQYEPELPAVLQEFSVEPVADPKAHRYVEMQQGDASKLPFPDKSFDLVFSFQALEQMQIVRDAAVSEMARVARRWVVLTEPLDDFNQDEIKVHYMRARGYLDLNTKELGRFGLEPVFVFGDFPQKLTSGVGIAVCKKRA
jgi:SAM-dependent methyltransferase